MIGMGQKSDKRLKHLCYEEVFLCRGMSASSMTGERVLVVCRLKFSGGLEEFRPE